MTETWKTIPEWEDYEVSDQGRVRVKESQRLVAQVLSGIPQYYYCNLKKGSVRKLVRVHRLVAQAFIPNHENLPIVDHIDRDRLNNNINNLRWVCKKGNQRNNERNVVLPCGTLLVEKVEQDLPYHPKAYHSIWQDMAKNQMTYEQAKELFLHNRKVDKVDWFGQEAYLHELCDKYNIDYYSAKRKLKNDHDIWCVMHKISDPHRFSVQTDTHWYPNKEYIANLAGITVGQVTEAMSRGTNIEDMIDDYYATLFGKHTLILNGVTYTASTHKLRQLTGLDDNTIKWKIRVGREAKRIIKYSINGVIKRKKIWCEEFGINPMTCSNEMSKKKITFEEYLDQVGIDTSNMEIIPIQ